MFAISFLVSSFFRLLNFAIFCALAWYIFRRYLKSRVEEKITQKEALLKGLEEQGYFLEGRAHNLENKFKMQEERAIQIKQKIAEWNIQVLAQNNKRHEEYKMNAAKNAQRITIKNAHIAGQQWRKQVIPHVIKNVSNDLAKQFADTAKARAYVHDIVQHLEGT